MIFRRIVVKIGTSTITAGTPHISPPRLVDLVKQMAGLYEGGCDVVVVSSGAIAAGREALNFPHLPKDIPAKQMLSAVGQPHLMALYEQLFGLYNITVAQVLLTRSDLANRRQYLNSRNTLSALLSHRVLPIVNENDTVATEEIRFGDNDNLSALVANLVEADLLVMLTDQPGLLTADPKYHPEAQLVREVSGSEIPPHLWEAAGGGSGLGTGGMTTKLQAADLARRSGATVAIARGTDPQVLEHLASGESIGTRFHPVATAIESRKRYILAEDHPPGAVTVDEGAVQALLRGGSLLPVGVLKVEEAFERGDAVRVVDEKGREVARGLANYTHNEVQKIKGRQSGEILSVLGFNYGDEVIHRDDMVLFILEIDG